MWIIHCTGRLVIYDKKKNIWLEVTRDKYELPVKIADSVEELAEMCGTSKNTIMSTISNWKKGRLKTCRFRKVEL